MDKTTQALQMFAEAEDLIKRAQALLRKGERKAVQLELFAVASAQKPNLPPSGASSVNASQKPARLKPVKADQPRTKKEKLAALDHQPQPNGVVKLEHARFALGIGHLHSNSRLRAMIDAGVLVPVTVGGKAVGVTAASVRKAINKGM